MRNLLIILLTIAFLGCATTSANVPETKTKPVIQPEVKEEVKKILGKYTYDGGIDPVVFNHWLAQPLIKEKHGITYAMKNPRKYAAIPFALVYLAQGLYQKYKVPDGTIMSFAYIEDSKLRFFVNKEGHYTEIDLPSEQATRLKKILEGFVGQ